MRTNKTIAELVARPASVFRTSGAFCLRMPHNTRESGMSCSTLRTEWPALMRASVMECGSPLPLFLENFVVATHARGTMRVCSRIILGDAPQSDYQT